MLVIMGASGRVGGAALAELARTRRDLRAISRQARASDTGVEWVTANALDADSLARAFAGAASVFVMNAAPIDAEDVDAAADRLSTSIASALATARVPHAVVLSSQGAQLASGTGIVGTLHRFERELRKVPGTSLTILRPAYFLETWAPLAQIALESGALPAFLDPPSRAIESVSASDVGKIAAGFLAAPQPGIVNVTGPTRTSDADAVAILSQLTGRTIGLAPVPAFEVAAAHEAVGLGASYSAGIAGLYESINRDGIPFEATARTLQGSSTLRDVLATLVR